MSAASTDVLIVGGGIAGLTAARRLIAAGATVTLLEANARVGGRTLSEPLGRGVFDLGGQWIGPTQTRMTALVAELGIETFPTYTAGRKVLEVGKKRSTYKGLIPSLGVLDLLSLQRTRMALERARKRVPPETIDGAPERGAPRAAALDAMSVAEWRRKLLPFAAGRAVFDAAFRVVFGAEPAETSLLHFLFYLNAGGGFEKLVDVEGAAQATRFVPGAQEVSIRLAGALGDRVRLGTPVRALAQDASGVTAHTDAGEFRAARAIIAVPPAVAGRIAVSPDLPTLRAQLEQRLPMGATIKCLATYDRPFWRDEGLSGEAVSASGPVTVTFDNTSHDGAQPALVAFVVGREARALSERPAAERRDVVLAALARFFGPAAAQPTAYVDKDWAKEPWIRGCPVGSAPPGVFLTFAPALRAPVGRIHFAGTETASVWNGYMEGAVESADRVAREVTAQAASGSKSPEDGR